MLLLKMRSIFISCSYLYILYRNNKHDYCGVDIFNLCRPYPAIPTSYLTVLVSNFMHFRLYWHRCFYGCVVMKSATVLGDEENWARLQSIPRYSPNDPPSRLYPIDVQAPRKYYYSGMAAVTPPMAQKLWHFSLVWAVLMVGLASLSPRCVFHPAAEIDYFRLYFSFYFSSLHLQVL